MTPARRWARDAERPHVFRTPYVTRNGDPVGLLVGSKGKLFEVVLRPGELVRLKGSWPSFPKAKAGLEAKYTHIHTPSIRGKSQRDARMEESLILPTRDQEVNALDEKYTQIVDIQPSVFLDLTTERGAAHFMRTTDRIIDLDFFKSPAIQAKLHVYPLLAIDAQTGQVTGHEGRHRAASVLKAGGKWYRTGLRLMPSSRQYKPEQMPQVWTGQFNRTVSFSVPRLIATDRLRMIDDNLQREYQRK